jgi:hypothetical protein
MAYAAKTIEGYIAAHPNDVKLWADYGAGDKFCSWIADVLRRDGFASIAERKVFAPQSKRSSLI